MCPKKECVCILLWPPIYNPVARLQCRVRNADEHFFLLVSMFYKREIINLCLVSRFVSYLVRTIYLSSETVNPSLAFHREKHAKICVRNFIVKEMCPLLLRLSLNPPRTELQYTENARGRYSLYLSTSPTVYCSLALGIGGPSVQWSRERRLDSSALNLSMKNKKLLSLITSVIYFSYKTVDEV